MDNVIIFGSKSPYKIPQIRAKEIFTSNGSAELAYIYNDKIKRVRHSCIIGAKSFLKLEDIKSRVIKSEPDELIIRDFDKDYSEIYELFKKEIIIKRFNKKEQFIYQKFFFTNGLLNLYLAELNYNKNLLKKMQHMFLSFFKYGFFGVSSGFFALLYASKKYPDSNLIVSGLSFEGGDHYYNSGKMTKNRGFVDSFLIKILKKQIKDRIFILDEDIAIKQNLKYFEEKILNLE